MMPAPRHRSRILAWSLAAGLSAMAWLSLISTPRPGLFAGRTVRAQGADVSARNPAGAPTAIDEIRSLVADLEAQAGAQRSQIQKTEASLLRARALLADLERGRGASKHDPDRQAPPLSLDPSWSPQERYLPEQSLAGKTPWSWPSETAAPEACARAFGGGYEVDIVEPTGPSSYRRIRVRQDGEEIIAWRAHSASVFVRHGDTLYYADFHPNATGCAVVAYNLRRREELWKTPLLGMGAVSHSMYTNRVNMKVDRDHLIVYGDEASGRYIELLNAATGRTVAHRVIRGRKGTASG
jgi:hypothetical protein